MAVVAAVLAVALAGVLLWVAQWNGSGPLVVSVLDYHEGTMRGPSNLPQLQSVSYKTQELRILLASSATPGAYTIAIERPQHVRRDLARFPADATAGQDGLVTIRAKVDLSPFPAGEYVVVWRRRNGWEDYASFLISR